MPQMVIIADDLTGAADTGACFAQADLVTLVALDPAMQYPESDVLVVSTESRHLNQDEAVAVTRRAAEQVWAACWRSEVGWVYKKIDSTLRGYPGPELAAVMEVLNLGRALVAPAFPAQGRTTLGGHQLVDGMPVRHTHFGLDVPCSNLLELFREKERGSPVELIELTTVRRGPSAVSEVLNRPEAAVVVADAETESDLITLAQAVAASPIRLLCGSAGLAWALSEVLSTWPDRQGRLVLGVPQPLLPPHCSKTATQEQNRGPALAVAGSRNLRTACQVEVAQQRGAVVIRPGQAFWGGDAGAIQETLMRAADQLAQGRDVILTTVGLEDAPIEEQAVADRLAQVVHNLVVGGQVGRLILTGGDIAVATCATLEASALWLRGEVQPGVPWGVLLGGLAPGLPIVTKAGGFGTDDVLAAAINLF